MGSPETATLPLVGLEGDNVLAFLASVGTLRALSLVWRDRRVRMSWRWQGAWQPVMHVSGSCTEQELAKALHQGLGQ